MAGDPTRSASVQAALEHRVARVAVEAGGGGEGRAAAAGEGGGEGPRAGAAGEERVAPGQARGLSKRVDRETTRALEPHLVLRSLERREQREAAARGAVTDPVAFVGTGRPCSPDELSAGEQELLV